MEGSRLRADGEDACAHGNGHTHDGKIPPGQIAFERMAGLTCFSQRLFDGFLRNTFMSRPSLLSARAVSRSTF